MLAPFARQAIYNRKEEIIGYELHSALDLGFINFQGHFFSETETFSPHVQQGRLQLPRFRGKRRPTARQK